MRLWAERGEPVGWVVEDNSGQFWRVPSVQGGWGRRRPFVGNVNELYKVDNATSRAVLLMLLRETA